MCWWSRASTGWGADYNEILEQWRAITKRKGAHVVVLDMPLLDTRTTQNGITGVFLADVVLQLLSYVAQIERDNTHQRQAEGIAAAKARGVRFGRPPLERPEKYGRMREAVLQGAISRSSAALPVGCEPLDALPLAAAGRGGYAHGIAGVRSGLGRFHDGKRRVTDFLHGERVEKQRHAKFLLSLRKTGHAYLVFGVCAGGKVAKDHRRVSVLSL